MFIENEEIYRCDRCNYVTDRLCDFNRHATSFKHSDLDDELSRYECVCGNKYKFMSGLSRHKKNCAKYSEAINNRNLMQLVLMQSQQTQQLINQMAGQYGFNPQQFNQNINTQNINNNFCLNIFLNETCKDAMSLDEFVDSIEVTAQDVERMEHLDYVSGITKLIVDKLTELTIINRPMHCTDSKRETVYVKVDTNWEKMSGEFKNKIADAVKKVAHKNLKAISLWTKQNPEWSDSNSQINDKYLKIVLNSMSGSTEEEQLSNINKIVKNVIREVIIHKSSGII